MNNKFPVVRYDLNQLVASSENPRKVIFLIKISWLLARNFLFHLLLLYNIKSLENIRQGFKRTISCNKYRSEIATQPKNNNLDYLTDQKFRYIGNNDPSVNLLYIYYMPLEEIKYFNALIDNKPFLISQ